MAIRTLRTLVNRFFAPLNVRVVNRNWGPRGVDQTFRRAREQGIVPRQVVDVGAFDGRWCRRARETFPEAQWLLIDPLPANAPALRRLAGEYPNIEFWEGAIGSQPGRREFHADADRSSLLASDLSPQVPTRSVEVRTLDSFLEDGRIQPPDLMFVDVAGYELEVLRSGPQCLKTVQLLMIHVLFRKNYKEMSLAHEVIAEAGRHGFRIFDICTYIQRNDFELAFAHILFVPDRSPLFKDEGFL